MTRLKKITLAALVALALAIGAAYVPAQQVAGDPSQWGVAKKGSFDLDGVNEYEGQHRVAAWSWGSSNSGSSSQG